MKPLRMFGTNWKMNKTAREAAQYAEIFRELLSEINGSGSIRAFVIPPYTSIAAVKQASENKFWVGAQNMHWDESGPYTGEISAPMLNELGVDIVQLGHAERREMCHESDISINLKVKAALRAGFRPLVCIGENLVDREFKVEPEICARQLRIALNDIPQSSVSRIIIAYEPAWAIGENGTTAESGHIRRMKDLFRSILEEMFGYPQAENVSILYGGSVSAEDAAGLLVESQTDGLFVGRAALDPVAFAALIGNCISAQSNTGPSGSGLEDGPIQDKWNAVPSGSS